MRYFPAFFDLSGRSVLLVGGGTAAAGKLRLLRKAGAGVRLVAPALTPEIEALAARGGIALKRRRFLERDLECQALVVAATGREAVDGAVSRAARTAGLPVNVVDRPELSSFVMPAIVDRDPVVVGISTGGSAPVLARRLRARIEAALPSRLGRLARFAESFRSAVAALVPDGRERRAFWEAFFDGPLARRVLAGEERAAREAMLSLVNRRGSRQAPGGSVALVGAGPGDPDLLTLRALARIQDADVLVYDRLVGPDILERARRDAARIDVGKAKGRQAASQDEINALLLREVRAGKRVVRLKGGDPYVFGRGGEEAEALTRHGIAVEVVPGITAAAGCAAAAGIPLTHRGLAPAATFVTGQGAAGAPEVDWTALARAGHTIAVYMGLSTAGTIARRLIAGGLAPTTPVAVIENGTRPDERIESGTLAGLEALIRETGLTGPALILIGEVVRLAGARAAAAPLEAAG